MVAPAAGVVWQDKQGNVHVGKILGLRFRSVGGNLDPSIAGSALTGSRIAQLDASGDWRAGVQGVEGRPA